jgi:transcriptional regulator with XRE-family HTH domain
MAGISRTVTLESLPDLLEHYRRSNGLTVADLAQRIGKSPAWFGRLRRGELRGDLGGGTAQRIAGLLGVPTDAVIEQHETDRRRVGHADHSLEEQAMAGRTVSG